MVSRTHALRYVRRSSSLVESQCQKATLSFTAHRRRSTKAPMRFGLKPQYRRKYATQPMEGTRTASRPARRRQAYSQSTQTPPRRRLGRRRRRTRPAQSARGRSASCSEATPAPATTTPAAATRRRRPPRAPPATQCPSCSRAPPTPVRPARVQREATSAQPSAGNRK